MFNELEKAFHLDLDGVYDPAGSRLHNRFSKRFEATSSDVTSRAAIDNFLSVFSHVSSPKIDLTDLELGDAKDFIMKTLESGCRYIGATYSIDTWPQATFLPGVLRHPDFLSWGKGKSETGHHTFIVDKLLNNELSITESCLPLVKYIKIFDSNLWGVLSSKADKISITRGGRITTVPKDQSIDRTIACEPSINLWFQLAIGKFISESLRSVGLNIEVQQNINRRYALEGSKFSNQWRDPFCTIDLSSASDLISLDLVKLLLPPELLQVILMTRSPEIRIDNNWTTLPMVSTMGCGFTFPLLTLICSALTYAANKHHKGGYLDFKQCAIFGDDIIVRKSVYLDTISVLSRAGLVVNESKSFCSGLFRESCGFDCYNGIIISPFYIRSLKTYEDVTIALNQALHWSSIHKPLYNVLEYLSSLLPKSKKCKVPYRFLPSEGILYPTTSCVERHVVYWKRSTDAKSVFIKDPNLQLFTVLAFGKIGQKKEGVFDYVTRESKAQFYRVREYFPFSWDLDADSVLKPSMTDYWSYDGKELRPFWDRRAFETIRLTTTQKKRLCQLVDIVAS